MIDYHVITERGEDYITTTHQDKGDATPLQLISAARLAYYITLEQTPLTFIETVAVVLPSAPPLEHLTPSPTTTAAKS